MKISERAAVLDQSGNAIPGLFACGEMVGGVFQGGYGFGAIWQITFFHSCNVLALYDLKLMINNIST